MQGSDVDDSLLQMLSSRIWYYRETCAAIRPDTLPGSDEELSKFTLISKEDIELITLCRSAQECGGRRLPAEGLTDILLPCCLLRAWAGEGQQWRAAPLPAEGIKHLLREANRGSFPLPAAHFPFPFPSFVPLPAVSRLFIQRLCYLHPPVGTALLVLSFQFHLLSKQNKCSTESPG